jgi:hypothetical protein
MRFKEEQINFLIAEQVISPKDSTKSEQFLFRKFSQAIINKKFVDAGDEDDEPNIEVEFFEADLEMKSTAQLIDLYKELSQIPVAILVEEIPEVITKSETPTKNRPEPKVKVEKITSDTKNTEKEESTSILPFLSINFNQIKKYNDDYFSCLDERIFFEFLLYRSEYNIRVHKNDISPVSYENARENTLIKLDRQRKLLREFRKKKLIEVTNDGHHGSKQIKINYLTILNDFNKIFHTGETEKERSYFDKLRNLLKKLSM